MSDPVTVVGAGLAGSEAAWQIACRGIPVTLVEMRPEVSSPAHRTGLFAELVCSNSLGGDGEDTPGGILKRELRRLGSVIMAAADRSSVPAGKALAVDRDRFSGIVTETLLSHPLIKVERSEMKNMPEGPAIIATGPLTSGPMAEIIGNLAGRDCLYFYDAVAPLVLAETVDMTAVYRKDRYSSDEGGDYLNCPLSREEYLRFYRALVSAERAPVSDFDKDAPYFEGCMPVEVLAGRGVDTLRFGPLRPVGLENPRTGTRPYAVVQLRQDNREGTVFNMVGFQTNLRWGEQERVFRLIPGLEAAEFVRKGVMHKNLYVNAPEVLDGSLRIGGAENLRLAGQITGVEGYVESTAMGAAAALAFFAQATGRPLPAWPRETAIGSLLHRLSDGTARKFQPTNVNLGIFPALTERIRAKADRCRKAGEAADAALQDYLRKNTWIWKSRKDYPILRP